MQFIILLYAGHCQQHSEVFFEFELALSLMPYAEMSRFFKTLLMIYFLPLSDSEYLLCSISLSLLALPVTLKKRKKKPKSDRSLFADVQFLGSELHGCFCNYDVVASSKGHLNCSWGFSCQGTKTYLKSTCVPCYEENQHPFRVFTFWSAEHQLSVCIDCCLSIRHVEAYVSRFLFWL